VWGSDEQVKQRLLRIVPPGSTPTRLNQESQKQGWKIFGPYQRAVAAGAPTYFHEFNGRLTCLGVGGPTVTIIVAEYGLLFKTSVEALWLFDRTNRLKNVCVRRTTDAL
jgi:hypothetical protein